MHPAQKISNLLRFENGFEIRNLHHFASKNVSHTICQILMVTEIELGQISWWEKIDNFKLGQIEKIVSFSERGSLTEIIGTIITNVQLLVTLEIFKFFENFNFSWSALYFLIFSEKDTSVPNFLVGISQKISWKTYV